MTEGLNWTNWTLPYVFFLSFSFELQCCQKAWYPFPFFHKTHFCFAYMPRVLFFFSFLLFSSLNLVFLLVYILLLVNIEKYAFSICIKNFFLIHKNLNYSFWHLLWSFVSVLFSGTLIIHTLTLLCLSSVFLNSMQIFLVVCLFVCLFKFSDPLAVQYHIV